MLNLSMSKEQYKQKSAEMLNKMLTKFVEDKGENWADLKNVFDSKMPEIIEQVCGDENTPEEKQEILNYLISNNIFQTTLDTFSEVGGVDIQEGLKEEIKELEKFIVKQQTKPKTGTTAHSKKKHSDFEKKVARMKRLYLKLKEKGYTEKQCYNLISEKYYPDHTPSTVDTYINKK